MALPGQLQTFAMSDCREMLDKLRWEIEQLKHPTTELTPTDLKYGCYNAAVTAWQLADWVAAETTDEQKRTLVFTDLPSLQAKIRSDCRELYLCRQVATASKHREVTLHLDTSVAAGVEVGAPRHLSGPVHFKTWRAFIKDGETKRPAIEVFELALAYWTEMIYRNHIASDDTGEEPPDQK